MAKRITITQNEEGQIVFDIYNLTLVEINGLLNVANAYFNESLKMSVTSNLISDKLEDAIKYEVKKNFIELGIEDMELSVRAYNALKANKIDTVKEVIQYTENELIHFRNMGRRSLDEIKDKLKSYNLSLKNNQ